MGPRLECPETESVAPRRRNPPFPSPDRATGRKPEGEEESET